MKILHEVCSLPTVPFVEDRVIAYARQFAANRGIIISEDSTGNLLLQVRGTDVRQSRWVFTAHMDHPGFIAKRMKDAKTLECDFHGGVYAEYLKSTKVRFFAKGGDVLGTVIEASTEKGTRIARRASVRVDRAVPARTPGMFEQGEGRLKTGKFYSRVIDDLAGAAAALEMLSQLAKKPPTAPVSVLLTRAEEDGFIGAIAASLNPSLLRRSDRLIAIECSAMQPFARQGDGCIIRIGDRTSIFHSGLSYFINQQAEKLVKKDKAFKYQRALMPGGTCEATVYDVYGFDAASICVPLGNYHNMDRDKKRIGPEYIDVNDWKSMVKLFLAIARTGHTYEVGHAVLKKKLEKRFNRLKKLL